MSAQTPVRDGSRIRTPSAAPTPFPVAGESTCELCVDLPHPVLTHCRRCHASWRRASRTAHCMTCHRTFTGPTVFDKHLLREGCTDPGSVKKRNGGLVFAEPRPNSAGTPVWGLPGTWTGPDGEGGQP